MSTTSTPKPNYVPAESIIAFAFIGGVFLVGLILRCLALNQSTIRIAQSLDLVIYQVPPRPVPAVKARLPSIEQQFDSNSEVRDQKASSEDSATPARVQRGPKRL